MCSIQCSSSYALCRWRYSREFGIFAQMYEKMKKELFFFNVQYVIIKLGIELAQI